MNQRIAHFFDNPAVNARVFAVDPQIHVFSELSRRHPHKARQQRENSRRLHHANVNHLFLQMVDRQPHLLSISAYTLKQAFRFQHHGAVGLLQCV